jgi:hypothetical protein
VRFPWRETRVAVAALARAAFARAARRAASRAFADAGAGAGAFAVRASSPASLSLDAALARAETHAEHVEARLSSFPEPPFTAQRLVELLLDPEASGYRSLEPLRRACDKLLAVTGMTAIESGRDGDRIHEGAGALEQSGDAARRAREDPVSLEQSAFVRALVGEAELQRGEDEDEDCSLVREKRQKIARAARRRIHRKRRARLRAHRRRRTRRSRGRLFPARKYRGASWLRFWTRGRPWRW